LFGGALAASRVAKWNGTIWSALGTGMDGTVQAFAVYDDGSGPALYAGGNFETAGGVPVHGVARWDGTNWSSLNGGANDIVFAIATDGNDVYIAGSFQSVGGVGATNIARWDGTNWWPLGEGTDAVIYCLAARNGHVYCGGNFKKAGGINATNIAHWNGTNWSNLGNGLRRSSTSSGSVRSLAIAGSDLFAGGDFRFAGDITATNIARWDRTNWARLGNGASGAVTALVPNGKDLYAIGSPFVDGLLVHSVGRWSGTNWFPVGSGVIYGGPAAGACNGSELFLGGQFKVAGGDKPSTNVAMWHIPYTLNIARSGNSDVLSWPSPGTNFVVQSATSIAASDWSDLPQAPVILNDECIVTNVATGPSQIYRLRRR